MLEDYFEDFILLTRTQTPDGLGGTDTQWADGPAFRGGVTQVVGRETAIGGLSTLCTVPMLLHDWEVTLMQGDRVRRSRDGAVYRVFGADYTHNKCSAEPGTVVGAGKNGIEIACADGETLLITELQAPGKKRMKAADFLRGHNIKVKG